jgi:putative polyhydroxyalkanoate system protein
MHAQHTMGRDEAQQAADRLAADLAEKFDIDYGWSGDHIHFERPGVDGTITVNDSEIRIKARLGLVLMFLKSRIEQEIVSYLTEHFDCSFPEA